METKDISIRLWAELTFAGFIILASAGLLFYGALDLPAMSALLPVAMLICLMILGVALIVLQYLRRMTVSEKKLKISNPSRALASFGLIVVYTLAVHYIGFYISTIVMVPSVAWLFGYRNFPRLLLATAIFVGGIYLIFSMLMGQRFPEEIFLR